MVSSAVALRHPSAAGWEKGVSQGWVLVSECLRAALLPAFNIPSRTALGREGEAGAAPLAGRSAACSCLVWSRPGQAAPLPPLRGALPTTEHPCATLPAVRHRDGARGRGHFARVSGRAPGRCSPDVFKPGGSHPRPSPSPTNGRRIPGHGAAPTAVPSAALPATAGPLGPPHSAPYPSGDRPRYLAEGRAGSRQLRGVAGHAASPPCWADPRWLRRRHRGGAGAGRRLGRGGQHVVQPRPRRRGGRCHPPHSRGPSHPRPVRPRDPIYDSAPSPLLPIWNPVPLFTAEHSQ